MPLHQKLNFHEGARKSLNIFLPPSLKFNFCCSGFTHKSRGKTSPVREHFKGLFPLILHSFYFKHLLLFPPSSPSFIKKIINPWLLCCSFALCKYVQLIIHNTGQIILYKKFLWYKYQQRKLRDLQLPVIIYPVWVMFWQWTQ